MLGLLGMVFLTAELKLTVIETVQECIDAYLQLSEDVFKVDQVLEKVPLGDDQCRFNYVDLETAIKGVIKERLDFEDVPISASTLRR